MNTGISPSAPIAFPSISLPKPPEGGNAGHARKTILIVDDNRVYVKATSMILRNAGYDVLTAFDGATAVSTVRQSKLDLILLDLNFPPASDLATCQDRCLKAGVLKVFSKPVDHEALLSTISETLRAKA